MDYFTTITSVDILTWTIGIMALRYISSTSLKRVNHKLGDKKAGVNLSERGKGGLGSGGSRAKGDGGRRVVHCTDVNTLYEGRFTRRAALLDKQKRDNADRVAAGCVSACCRALREVRHDRACKEASQVKADRSTVGTPAMGLNHEALTR